MPIKRVKPDDSSLVKEAQDVVTQFEHELQNLQAMRQEFAEKFPEAKTYLDDIFRQEDILKDLTQKAKEKVAAAKETVGPFACTRKFAKAGYDDEAIMGVMIQQPEEAPSIFMSLLTAGAIKSIKTDKDVTNAFLSRNPKVESKLHEAWRDKTELTPSVSVPKF